MKGRNRLALGLALTLALLALAGCREFPSLGPLEEPPSAAAELAEARAGRIPLEDRMNCSPSSRQRNKMKNCEKATKCSGGCCILLYRTGICQAAQH